MSTLAGNGFMKHDACHPCAYSRCTCLQRCPKLSSVGSLWVLRAFSNNQHSETMALLRVAANGPVRDLTAYRRLRAEKVAESLEAAMSYSNAAQVWRTEFFKQEYDGNESFEELASDEFQEGCTAHELRDPRLRDSDIVPLQPPPLWLPVGWAFAHAGRKPRPVYISPENVRCWSKARVNRVLAAAKSGYSGKGRKPKALTEPEVSVKLEPGSRGSISAAVGRVAGISMAKVAPGVKRRARPGGSSAAAQSKPAVGRKRKVRSPEAKVFRGSQGHFVSPLAAYAERNGTAEPAAARAPLFCLRCAVGHCDSPFCSAPPTCPLCSGRFCDPGNWLRWHLQHDFLEPYVIELESCF